MSRSFIGREFGHAWQSYVATYRLYLSSRGWAFGFLVTAAAQVLLYYLLNLKYRPQDVHSSGMWELYAILCLPHLGAGLGWWWSRRAYTHILGASVVVLTLALIGAEVTEEVRLANGGASVLGGYGWVAVLLLLPQGVLGVMCLALGLGDRFGPRM